MNAMAAGVSTMFSRMKFLLFWDTIRALIRAGKILRGRQGKSKRIKFRARHCISPLPLNLPIKM